MPDNSTSAGYLEMQKDHGAQYSTHAGSGKNYDGKTLTPG